MVTTMVSGANGRSSRNRQTPEKLSGSSRAAHLASKSARPARDRQAVPVVNDVDQVAASRAREMGLVDGEGAPQHAGLMHCWNAASRERATRLCREVRTALPSYGTLPFGADCAPARPGPGGLAAARSIAADLPARTALTVTGSTAGRSQARNSGMQADVRFCTPIVHGRSAGRLGTANVLASQEDPSFLEFN